MIRDMSEISSKELHIKHLMKYMIDELYESGVLLITTW